MLPTPSIPISNTKDLDIPFPSLPAKLYYTENCVLSLRPSRSFSMKSSNIPRISLPIPFHPIPYPVFLCCVRQNLETERLKRLYAGAKHPCTEDFVRISTLYLLHLMTLGLVGRHIACVVSKRGSTSGLGCECCVDAYCHNWLLDFVRAAFKTPSPFWLSSDAHDSLLVVWKPSTWVSRWIK